MATNLDTTLMIVIATAVLHNICQFRNEEEFEDGDEIWQPPPRQPCNIRTAEGITARDQIVADYFT